MVVVQPISVLLLQSRVQVVHFAAVLVASVSLSLDAVMELKNVLMAVMRLAVAVSYHYTYGY